MNRRVAISCVIALIMPTMALSAAETLRILPIVHDNQLLVSFQTDDAYNDEVRDAIASGLQVTFDYDVDVRMVVPAWIDRTVVTSTISISVKYDNLTRRHTLQRFVDGRVQDSIVTDDAAVVQRWLTTMTRLPICPASKLEPDRDYYVRITARVRPNRGSLFGFSKAFSAQTKFTFIP